MTRRTALGPIVVAVALLCGGVLLAGCSDGGDSLARQACSDVKHSIAALNASAHAPTSAAASADQARAYADLRDALQPAAEANSANGQWNALMTTISEVARVPEQHLVVALEAQCAVADSPNPGNAPQIPLTVPGGGTTPGSSTTSTSTSTTVPGTGSTSASSSATSGGD